MFLDSNTLTIPYSMYLVEKEVSLHALTLTLSIQTAAPVFKQAASFYCAAATMQNTRSKHPNKMLMLQ